MVIEASIIVALIGGACSIIGQYLIAHKNRLEDETKQAIKDAIMEQRLNTIDKKLDEHNGYAEKFAETAERLARIEQKLEDKI